MRLTRERLVRRRRRFHSAGYRLAAAIRHRCNNHLFSLCPGATLNEGEALRNNLRVTAPTVTNANPFRHRSSYVSLNDLFRPRKSCQIRQKEE